jgi:predicted RNA binding protein YcfA (HicA-like mRNA interferase family)
MSEHLPALSGKECIGVLEKAGWSVARQRGSHIVLRKAGYPRGVCVPNHTVIDKGTLASLIRQSGLTQEEFRKLL